MAAWLAASFAFPVASAYAQTAPVAGEEKVKAAFLHRLLYYIEFPPEAFPRQNSPYVVGVMEDDLIAEELNRLTVGKLVHNRPVVVTRVAPGAALNDLHVLFIGRSERLRQPFILKQLRSDPVFRVTETEGSLEQGSMFNFRIIDDKVRFEVSLLAAEQSRLRISSRILPLAVKILKANQ